MGSVDRLLYRQLLRQGRAHDRIPAFKALLANQRTRVYSREESCWTELEHRSELAAEELRSHAAQLFGGGTNCTGVWYAPSRSLAELVRDCFRHDRFAGCKIGEGVVASNPGSEDRLAERRDVAFSALRQLHSNLQFGQRVLTGRHLDDDIASYLHSAKVAEHGCGGAGIDEEEIMVGDGDLRLRESPLHCAGLLIAHPLQCSGAFWRTVLLVCTHDKQQGAMALVLNRSTGKRLGDVVSSQHLASSRLLQMFAEHPLFYGGPVAPNALFYLHTNDHVGGEQVGSGTGLYWRPAMHDAAIEHAIDNGEAAPGDFRLFCGYTGWGPDQLEGEIEQNAWFTARCETQSGVPQPLARSLMTLADGPKWARLEQFSVDDTFGMSEQALQTVESSAHVDVLEQSMRRWVSALTLLGGEYSSFGAHFQSMPHDLNEEDVLEIHRRAVG